MASYYITETQDGRLLNHCSRFQRKAAARAFERMLYACIRSFAQLDTRAGWKAYEAGQRIAAAVEGRPGMAVNDASTVAVCRGGSVTIKRLA